MPRQDAAPRPVRHRSDGLQTRADIVAAAERHFAERGFEAARLEDIATEVGIRRAAIFYHFGDKQEVYEAVLESVFGEFAEALPTEGSAAERLEDALTGWIDFVARRPSVARLILREAAGFKPGKESPFVRAAGAAVDWFRALIDEGVASGELAPRIEPHRCMSLMGAVTVFHFAAMPWLTLNEPGEHGEAGSSDELDKHKREILLVARGVLGIDDKPLTGAGEEK